MPASEEIGSAQVPRLQLFGRFRLTQAGAEVSLPGRKARAILAFLALAPDLSATREQLSYLMWTDRGPEQARASLRQSLKELRELTATSQAVAITRSGVELPRGAVTSDLREIRHAAAARDLPRLADLLEGVRGDLLEDFLDVSPGFDEWLQAERPRQRDLLAGAALEAVEADGLAQMKDTRSILRSLDRLDPVNEAVVRLGMRMDHASGDSASLHRRYRQLCERLDSEFDAVPSEETRALFHAFAANRQPPQPATQLASATAEPARAQGRPLVGDMVPLVLVATLQTHASDAAIGSLAEFCANDLRTALSRIRGIQVLAVEGERIDTLVEESEETLGLYLLSGSIRQIGGDYRATLQLANAQSHAIVWSDSLRFGEAGEEMLDTLVAKAAGATLPAIDSDLAARLRQASDELGDERAIYTRARLLIRTAGDLEAVQEAVQLLEGLVESDPRHLGARLLLTRMYNTAFWQQIAGHDIQRFRELSDTHLQAALAIAPGHCEVRLRQAWCQLRAGEVEAARKSFAAVLANLPHDADMTNVCAFGLCNIGDFAQAEELMQRAFFLNPLPPSDYHADYGVLLALRGDHEAAEEHFAVSGENGLQYLAVRLANATEIEAGIAGMSQMAAKFIDAFHRAWQPDRPPQMEDLLDWIEYVLPLSPACNMEWLKAGVQRTLAPMWPGADDSSR